MSLKSKSHRLSNRTRIILAVVIVTLLSISVLKGCFLKKIKTDLENRYFETTQIRDKLIRSDSLLTALINIKLVTEKPPVKKDISGLTFPRSDSKIEETNTTINEVQNNSTPQAADSSAFKVPSFLIPPKNNNNEPINDQKNPPKILNNSLISSIQESILRIQDEALRINNTLDSINLVSKFGKDRLSENKNIMTMRYHDMPEKLDNPELLIFEIPDVTSVSFKTDMDLILKTIEKINSSQSDYLAIPISNFNKFIDSNFPDKAYLKYNSSYIEYEGVKMPEFIVTRFKIRGIKNLTWDYRPYLQNKINLLIRDMYKY